jgi:glyoxylate carboligase
MLGTNGQFESLIRSLDARIASLERQVLQGTAGASGAVLDELWARRRSLRLLILNRRVEAAKPVVDFGKWRDGNGAIYLCAGTITQPRKLAR